VVDDEQCRYTLFHAQDWAALSKYSNGKMLFTAVNTLRSRC
jgi:hypothetical protein